jgi:hypothetical protein
MAWVKIDDQLPNHVKVAYLEDMVLPALGLNMLALCWCNSQLTDGFIPEAQVRRLAGNARWLPLAEVLVKAGFWEEVDGGYQIHDYLDYQPSKEDVLATKELKRRAGKAGGLAKAKQAASTVLADAKQPASKGQADAKQNSTPYPYPYPSPKPEPPPPAISNNGTVDNADFREPLNEDTSLTEAAREYERVFGRPVPNAVIAQAVCEWLDEVGLDCLRHCLAETARAGVRDWRYTEAILRRHLEEGCVTASEPEEDGAWAPRELTASEQAEFDREVADFEAWKAEHVR